MTAKCCQAFASAHVHGRFHHSMTLNQRRIARSTRAPLWKDEFALYGPQPDSAVVGFQANTRIADPAQPDLLGARFLW
jgi:hypothetical protein